MEDPSQPLIAWHRVPSTNQDHCCNPFPSLWFAGQKIHQVAPIAVTYQDYPVIALQRQRQASALCCLCCTADFVGKYDKPWLSYLILLK